MYKHRPLRDFNFYFEWDNYDDAFVIGTELSRTCDYLEKSIGKRAFLTVSVMLKEDTFITVQVLNGKAYLGIYDSETGMLNHYGKESDFISKTFADTMNKLRKTAMKTMLNLENGLKVDIDRNILTRWIDYDHSLQIFDAEIVKQKRREFLPVKEMGMKTEEVLNIITENKEELDYEL